MSFYSENELTSIGFKSVGKNAKVSNKTSIYGAEFISIGDNVRIDDFCILSAGKSGISVGSFVHIAAYTSLIGQEKISLMDFANISSRVSIYSNNDDYSGEWMTNPIVPSEFTSITRAPVSIGKHVIVGSGSIILPGATLEEGVAVGALSLVKGLCKEFGVYCGTPAKRISERKRDVLLHEQVLLASLKEHGS